MSGKYRLLMAPVILFASFVVSLKQVRAALEPARCVGLASDSNGYGHVTFQLGQGGDVGIIFVQPLWIILQQQLQALGLRNLKVIDRSLSAGGLTSSEATNYLASIPYGNLINDRCQFVIVGPFLPDVAAGRATPEQYSGQMVRLVLGLLEKSPDSIIFVLNHYRTERAEFTVHNSGRGMTQERIDAFNARIANSCRPDGSLGRWPQVICVDVQSLFADLGNSYLLKETTRAQYEALVNRPTAFRARVERFYEVNPDGRIIGDGMHLSLAGRIRLMQRMAEWISRIVPI